MKRFALMFCFILAPVACQASDPCPWINASTAFGALGITPDAAGSSSATTATSCTFAYRTPNALSELRVTVEQSSDAAHSFLIRKAACSSDLRPLSAIGNEAIICSVNPATNVYGRQVIGRVRDQIFTLTMTVGGVSTPARTDDLQQKAEMLAELVSGNLF